MGLDQEVKIDRRKLPRNVNQLGLIQALLKELTKQGIKGELHHRYFNAVIRAADVVCDEFARETVVAPAGAGLAAWIASDEVGASSLCMARTLSHVAGIECPKHRYGHENRHPLDVSDFRRCVQMLDAVPELREHIPAMKALGPIWARLADKWSELESLYASERGKAKCPKTHALLIECIKE